MPNQIFTDEISVLSKHTETTFELATDREILLADYDRPVFKIVKTLVEHSVTQKYINGNRLVLEGFFRTSVFYQPPQGEPLTVISKKQPFQKQVDLAQPVQGPHFVTVKGELQYVNTRAVNPARIAVNGVYSFDVRLYTAGNIPVITASGSDTVCADTEELQFFTLCGAATKQFSMEDDISVPENTDKILHISAQLTDISAISYQDRVNIKGEAEAEILYSMHNSADVHRIKKKFAFNQLADIQGTAENNVSFADLSVNSVTVTGNTDSGRVNCILTANADIRVFRKNSVITVLDAFSKKYDCTRQQKRIALDKNITAISQKFPHTVADNIGTGYTPLCCFVNLSSPFFSAGEDKNRLQTRFTATAVVRNADDECECFVKSGEIDLNIPGNILPDDQYILSCNVSDRHITVSADTLKVDFTVSVNGFITDRQSKTVLDNFEENTDQPIPSSADALILYYGSAGENLFDIAMKYHTDMHTIMTENSMDTKILAEDKMLIIPSFG